VKSKITHLPEQNIGDYHYGLRVEKNFLYKNMENTNHRRKTDTFIYIQIKNFCSSKMPLRKWRGNLYRRREIKIRVP
jgi:hypothetical protein